MKVSVKLATWRKAQKSTRMYHCPEWYEVRRGIPETFRKWEQNSENLKGGVEVVKRYCYASSQ